MGKVITGNIEQEYRRATSQVVEDISSLPEPIRTGMKRRAATGVTVDRVE